MTLSNGGYGLFVVNDSDDARSRRRMLLSERSGDSSTLFVDVPAGSLHSSKIAKVLLEAMGKEIVLEGGGTSAAFEWSCARAWVEGLGIKEIIFLRAHLLTPSCIDSIAEFAIATDISVTLVVVPQEAPANHRFGMRSWPFTEVALNSLIGEMP
jgi:hypothetical protein